MPNRFHNCFSRVLSDSLACLKMWFMIDTHDLLQSFGLNFGTTLHLVQSLVVPITSTDGKKERLHRALE